MQKVWQKFKHKKVAMKGLAKEEPDKIEGRVVHARAKLKDIQMQMRDHAKCIELVQEKSKIKKEL